MALQGTIRDFGLPDIFQLIGIQRKTGVLTLENGKDTVTVQFLEGQVVGADTRTESLEDRLGAVLVRGGKITEAQLQEALRAQDATLRRLGHILVNSKFISEEDLVDALRVQSTQIIYRLFRWRDGQYQFSAVEDLDYDQRHFTPISSETILMEGARMIDEWPLIERRVRSPRMIFRPTDRSKALLARAASAPHTDPASDHDLPARAGLVPGERLAGEERAILALLDGRRSVEETCDVSMLGEFDTYRVLADLLRRQLVEEVQTPLGESVGERNQLFQTRVIRWLSMAAVIFVATLGTRNAQRSPLSPSQLMSGTAGTETLKYHASFERLERLGYALHTFYLNSGRFPSSLEPLADNGYVRPVDLADAWGHPFRYELSSGGFQLAGIDADGRPRDGLQLSRQLTAQQRLMTAAGGPSAN